MTTKMEEEVTSPHPPKLVFSSYSSPSLSPFAHEKLLVGDINVEDGSSVSSVSMILSSIKYLSCHVPSFVVQSIEENLGRCQFLPRTVPGSHQEHRPQQRQQHKKCESHCLKGEIANNVNEREGGMAGVKMMPKAKPVSDEDVIRRPLSSPVMKQQRRGSMCLLTPLPQTTLQTSGSHSLVPCDSKTAKHRSFSIGSSDGSNISVTSGCNSRRSSLSVGGGSIASSTGNALVPAPHHHHRTYSSSSSSSSSLSYLYRATSLPGRTFPMPLPCANTYHDASLLLVDISGFTRLSTLLEVESLSKAINNYFELLVKEVEEFGGEVLKFAGDALYAEWRIHPLTTFGEYGEVSRDNMIEEAVAQATLCGASIVKKCSDYRVQIPGPGNCVVAASSATRQPGVAVMATLDVHCGVGVGEMAVVHVGNHESRREFIVIGDPIGQVSKAEEMAQNGELAASPEAMKVLKRICEMPIDLESSEGPAVVASRADVYLKLKDHFKPFHFLDEISTPELPQMSNVALEMWRRHQISLYVHPAARREDLHDCTPNLSLSRKIFTDEELHRAEAELRYVYVIFTKPLIDVKITGEKNIDQPLFQLLNDIMGVTTKVLDRFKGHLRQFIVDDKGAVLIATFGLRGATFPNMVAEKGLPATIAMYDALQTELNVESHVGATLGKAYCGVVGGVRRHEFAVLGPSVNLAARLMASPQNPGILVDNAVRLKASNRFEFLSLPPVEAKGYSEPVPIFEPIRALGSQWKRVSGFVGRDVEVQKLVHIARKLMVNRNLREPQMVLVQADSGGGKSSMVIHAMDKIRRLGESLKANFFIEKNICKDDEMFVPFSVFRQIVMDFVKDYVPNISAEDDDSSSCSSSNSSSSTICSDLLSSDHGDNYAPSFAPTCDSNVIILEQLHALCRDMGYSADFAAMIGENVLGLQPHNAISEKPKPSQLNEVLNFIVEAFMKCTCNVDMVLLAIDDVQWMDSLSWKVIRRLFEINEKKLMIICISRPFETNNLAIEPDFLEIIQGHPVIRKNSRITDIRLSPLGKRDIRALVSKVLSTDEIDEGISDFIYEQTGGMPYFAQEIIRIMKRNDILERNHIGILTWRSGVGDKMKKSTFTGLNDLLLHRLDHLDSFTRKLLQVCAVLGFQFLFSELIMVQRNGEEGTGTNSSKQIKAIQEAIDLSVKEKILKEVYTGGLVTKDHMVSDSSTISERSLESSESFDIVERSFSFSHSIWRNCVLGTMLKERERDLHRLVATITEGEDDYEVVESRSALKLFGHWKASGDLMKASSLAIKIGKYFDSMLLQRQSIDFYLEAIGMWKDWPSDESVIFRVGGISRKLLNRISADQLTCLAKLHIAVAKCYANIKDGKNANEYYQNCDSILSVSVAAVDLKDRSVFFTLYSGIFALIQSGFETGILQEDLAKRFVEQAQLHGDPVHIARALAMESLTMGGLGRFEEAVAIQRQLEDIYCAEELSAKICREYATDRAGQNYGYSVLWYENLGQHEKSQKQIDFILEKLMPIMPKKNVHNSFVILFPVLWVLKDRGMAHKAETVFITEIFDNFHEHYGKDSTTFFFSVYKPLKVLFRLARDNQENSTVEEIEYQEMEDWVLSPEVGLFGKIQAVPMCSLGRDPHCIIAEICWLLALAHKRDKKQVQLLEKGFEQAEKSMSYTKEGVGIIFARRQSENIMKKFMSKVVQTSI